MDRRQRSSGQAVGAVFFHWEQGIPFGYRCSRPYRTEGGHTTPARGRRPGSGGLHSRAPEELSTSLHLFNGRVVRRDPGLDAGGADGRGQCGGVVCAVVAAPVDEERRCAGDTAQVGRLHIGRDPGRAETLVRIPSEPGDIEPELLGVADQVGGAQFVLMAEEEIVHWPERVLDGGRLGCLGGVLGVWMDVCERAVAPDVAHAAEVREELSDDRLRLAAVASFEVAVLDDGHQRVLGAADAVAVGIDG